MENWLSCTVSPGQFEGEYGVDGKQYDGTSFSLFAPKDAVRVSKEPTLKKSTEGWVRVEVMDRSGDLILVRLPRQTFQSGPFITVKVEQLEKHLPAATKKAPA